MTISYNNANGVNPQGGNFSDLKLIPKVREKCSRENLSATIKTASYSIQIIANGTMYIEGEGGLYINLTNLDKITL